MAFTVVSSWNLWNPWLKNSHGFHGLTRIQFFTASRGCPRRTSRGPAARRPESCQPCPQQGLGMGNRPEPDRYGWLRQIVFLANVFERCLFIRSNRADRRDPSLAGHRRNGKFFDFAMNSCLTADDDDPWVSNTHLVENLPVALEKSFIGFPQGHAGQLGYRRRQA